MDERTIHSILSGERRGISPALLRGALSVVSVGYGAAVAVRNLAFDRGWRHIHRALVPVISLGNLTTGGTGKTPCVAWLINELRQRGLHPGLLSRGYRSFDGGENDESRVIERLCPGVPHVQNRDRVAGARTLLSGEPLLSPLPTGERGQEKAAATSSSSTTAFSIAGCIATWTSCLSMRCNRGATADCCRGDCCANLLLHYAAPIL